MLKPIWIKPKKTKTCAFCGQRVPKFCTICPSCKKDIPKKRRR